MTKSELPAETSWTEVYRANSVRLMRLATGLVGADDAADLVVETVQRVVHSPSFGAAKDPLSYLSRSLVNAAMSQHRSAVRGLRREQRTAGRESTKPFDPTDTLDVRGALSRLSPQQRAIVFLAYWEDLAIPQIAVWLEVTEGTVRPQLARAKDRLREVLQ